MTVAAFPARRLLTYDDLVLRANSDAIPCWTNPFVVPSKPLIDFIHANRWRLFSSDLHPHNEPKPVGVAAFGMDPQHVSMLVPVSGASTPTSNPVARRPTPGVINSVQHWETIPEFGDEWHETLSHRASLFADKSPSAFSRAIRRMASGADAAIPSENADALLLALGMHIEIDTDIHVVPGNSRGARDVVETWCEVNEIILRPDEFKEYVMDVQVFSVNYVYSDDHHWDNTLVPAPLRDE